MEWKQSEWLGEWINFESLIFSKEPAMKKCWAEAEQAAAGMPMFRGGAAAFWTAACNTVNGENPVRLGGWNIQPKDGNLEIAWLDEGGEILCAYDYAIAEILEKGLEGKPNFLFRAENAPENSPFRYLLAMEPMPERDAAAHGGLLSHLHFQFASSQEKLLVDGKLANPMWYATMCAKGTMLQYCNIVRALHRLPTWDALPE